MLSKRFLLACVVLALLAIPCLAESVEGLPLHVKQLAPGVVRVWVGDYISSTAVCAVATQKGIVVIDSTDIPVLDEAFRKVIAKALGRKDFAYLINTHGHGDHTNGNGVYSDCEIIAHELVTDMMRGNAVNRARQTTWRTEDIQRLKDQIASGKMSEEEQAAAKERIIINKLSLEFLQANPEPTFPTKTFTDTMVLDCGDITFELYQTGGTHTRSDIFIFLPQKRILFTGDMMADKWLTDTPGCLATFAAASGEVGDFPVLLRNWQAMLDRQDDIDLYVPGHWNGELSAEGFRARFEYLTAMLEDVPAMIEEGQKFEEILAGYPLKEKFPQLADSPGVNANGHRISIQHLYQVYTGKIPFGQNLWPTFMDNTFPEKFPEMKADILQHPDKYFTTEAELNALGYFLLNEQKQADHALKLFELAAELYPESWNVYDSLAEACYAVGEKEKALKLYRKSVELNPDNENGQKYIKKIELELNK
jgi:glyoxylase-like metal-dependent hydrolase (beta-lactamase superfamily II)